MSSISKNENHLNPELELCSKLDDNTVEHIKLGLPKELLRKIDALCILKDISRDKFISQIVENRISAYLDSL